MRAQRCGSVINVYLSKHRTKNNLLYKGRSVNLKKNCYKFRYETISFQLRTIFVFRDLRVERIATDSVLYMRLNKPSLPS